MSLSQGILEPLDSRWAVAAIGEERLKSAKRVVIASQWSDEVMCPSQVGASQDVGPRCSSALTLPLHWDLPFSRADHTCLSAQHQKTWL